MDDTRTYLAKVKGADPEEFVFVSTSADGSQMKTLSAAFTEHDFRSDMLRAGMPGAEIEAKIAHARANPF